MPRWARIITSLLLLVGPAFAQREIFWAQQLRSGGAGCGLPNFCSPTNTNNDQTSAPAALIGVLCGAGLSTGSQCTFTDVTNNLIIRATDYGMGGGTTGTASFRANSDSNDNVWSSDDQIVGICRTNGGEYLDAFNPSTHVITPKGHTGGNGACDGVSWAHATPATYYWINGANQLEKAVINTSSGTWTGSTGGNSNMGAAITSTQLLDISTQCSGLTYNRYNFLSNIYGFDGADRYLTFGARVAQDQGFQHFIYDSVNGCSWVDFRTMTTGGAWGHGSITNAANWLLPSPGAPTLTQTTGGSLTTHQYKVGITYTKSGVGETTLGTTTLITLGGGNNAISIAPPTASPSGTISQATHFNVYACDNTAVPGCAPTMQSNGTNASGALAQPVITSAPCAINCTNNGVTYTIWVAAINAGGQSPLSAPFTTASVSNNASFTVNVNQVTNATGYTVWVDFKYNIALNNNAGTCAAGNCALTVNANSNAVGFLVGQVSTVPIATTPVITSINTGTDQAPAVNSTGTTYHDIKNDPPWLTMAPPSGGSLQSAYSGNARYFFDWSTGVMLFANNTTSTPSLNVALMGLGHMAVGCGKFFGNDANGGLFPVTWTLNDSSTTAEASKVTLANFSVHTTDVHMSAQYRSINCTYPWFFAADGSGYASHAIPTDAYATYIRAIKDQSLVNQTWKFCQNWESGLQGFNSQVSGNPSPDGKFVLFSSDMGIGTSVTSGQVGNSSGLSSCTDNTDCRTDAYVCVSK